MIDKLNKLLKPICSVRRAYVFFIAFAVTAVMIGGNYEKSTHGGMTAAVYVPAVTEEPAADEAIILDTEYEFAYDYLDIDGSDTLYAAAKKVKAKELTAVTEDTEEAEPEKAAKKSGDIEKTENLVKEQEKDKDAVTSGAGEEKPKKKKKASDKNESGFMYSEDIPISRELQEYTYNKCAERGIEYELILAVMWRESRFTLDAVNVNSNGTRDNGLMQINDVNRKWLREKHGIVDLLDPYQNIDAGTAMLGELTAKYGAHNALLAYQYGEGGMARKLKQGQTTSKATELAYAQRDYYRQIIV